MSTCGPAELPAACRAQAGRRCSRRSDSSTSASVRPSTRSVVQRVKRRPGRTRCSATPSLRATQSERNFAMAEQDCCMTSDGPAAIRARQQRHWAEVLAANPDMYGLEPSSAAIHAAEQFAVRGVTTVLELGAGQGRDTMFLGAQGFDLVALDYVDDAIATIRAKAATTGLANVTAMRHDVREPLPFAEASFDASYSHMLFCMALTTSEIMRLADETRRVLRPGGTVIYTVRHTGDAHYGTGVPHGD